MAKRKRPEKADGEVNEERGVKPIPIWEKNWFPAALFLLLSLLYFHEFVLSDKVVYGYDAGLDFHKGEGMSFWEKVETMAQPMWNPQMGGLPQSEEIRPQYFLTYPIYFFTTFHRYLGWRYILTMFFSGLGMYLFLRQIQIQRWVAILGGVAYMSAPTLMAFTFAGQYAKMGVIALYPWMWYCLDRGLYSRRLIYFAGLAITIAWGIYSPHPKMLYYALCGTGLYFLFRTYQYYQEERDTKRAASRVGLSLSLPLCWGWAWEPKVLFRSIHILGRSQSELLGRREVVAQTNSNWPMRKAGLCIQRKLARCSSLSLAVSVCPKKGLAPIGGEIRAKTIRNILAL